MTPESYMTGKYPILRPQSRNLQALNVYKIGHCTHSSHLTTQMVRPSHRSQNNVKQKVYYLLALFMGQQKDIFLKKWAILGLFFVYFRLFKPTLQFLKQIYVKKCYYHQYMAPGFEPTTFVIRVFSITTRKTYCNGLANKKVRFLSGFCVFGQWIKK